MTGRTATRQYARRSLMARGDPSLLITARPIPPAKTASAQSAAMAATRAAPRMSNLALESVMVGISRVFAMQARFQIPSPQATTSSRRQRDNHLRDGLDRQLQRERVLSQAGCGASCRTSRRPLFIANVPRGGPTRPLQAETDRQSKSLNSSHLGISY